MTKLTEAEAARLHPETLALSYGFDPWLSEGSVKPPVFLTSTFAFKHAADGKQFFAWAHGEGKLPPRREMGLIYSRINNPNLEIFDLKQMASLNYMCDDFGVDTISAGATLSFYADAIDQGATQGDFKFGDAERAKELLRLTARREGIGIGVSVGDQGRDRVDHDRFGLRSYAVADIIFRIDLVGVSAADQLVP